MSSNAKKQTEERRFTVIKPEKGIELVDDFRDGLKRDMSLVDVGESFLLNKKQRPLVGSYSKNQVLPLDLPTPARSFAYVLSQRYPRKV